MSKLFPVYRVLALVVGVLLVVGTLSSICKYLLTEGSALQELGEQMSILWVIHGNIYMVYVVVAFFLARAARWSVQFTLLLFVAGLIPGLMFWVEHRVVERMREGAAPA